MLAGTVAVPTHCNGHPADTGTRKPSVGTQTNADFKGVLAFAVHRPRTPICCAGSNVQRTLYCNTALRARSNVQRTLYCNTALRARSCVHSNSSTARARDTQHLARLSPNPRREKKRSKMHVRVPARRRLFYFRVRACVCVCALLSLNQREVTHARQQSMNKPVRAGTPNAQKAVTRARMCAGR